MTDLTNLTVDELLAGAIDMSLLPETYPRELMQIRGANLNELARRAQANDARVDFTGAFEKLREALGPWLGKSGEGLALMRSAPPAPVTRFDDVKSHARRLLTAWWQDPDVDGINPDVEVQKQFVREAKRFFRMVLAIDNAAPPEPPAPPAPVAPVTEGDRWRQLAEVKQVRIDRLKEDLHAAQEEVEKLRAPVAPVTDAEVEAAIRAYRSECIAPPDDDACEDEAFGYLRSLIARRVAEARGAGLRELRARLLSTAASFPNRQMGHSDEGFDRGYVEACENWAQEIDRLLAAPPASKLAEEPAQESKTDLSWRSEFADLKRVTHAEWLRHDKLIVAIHAQVERVARRIEALENNKEAAR